MSIAADAAEWISVTEAARLLGVSRPTVYRLIERGSLPSERSSLTGRRRVSRAALATLQDAASLAVQEGVEVAGRNGHQEGRNGVFPTPKTAETPGLPPEVEQPDEETVDSPRPSLWPPGTPEFPKLNLVFGKLSPIPPPPDWPEDGPPWSVDSLDRLDELAITLPVDDFATRLDYYRFHGLPQDATSDAGHIGPDRESNPERDSPRSREADDEGTGTGESRSGSPPRDRNRTTR